MTTSSSDKDHGNNSCVTGINHVGLSVADLDASIEFYSKAIDIEVDMGQSVSNLSAERASGFINESVGRATLKAPNTYLQLCQFDRSVSGPREDIPVKGPGIVHACYQSLKTDKLFSKFLSQGATSVTRGSEPISLLGQGVYYAYARDPDGIMFEVEHLDRSPFESPIWFAHVALVAHDIDSIVEFYKTLLGKPPARRSDSVKGPTFDQVANYDDVKIRAAWFDLDNMTLEFWQFLNPVTPEPGEPAAFEKTGYNKIAFEVSNIQSEYRRLSALGVPFLSEPIQSKESTEVYGRDPEGNLFSLIELAPGSSRSIKELEKKSW